MEVIITDRLIVASTKEAALDDMSKSGKALLEKGFVVLMRQRNKLCWGNEKIPLEDVAENIVGENPLGRIIVYDAESLVRTLGESDFAGEGLRCFVERLKSAPSLY